MLFRLKRSLALPVAMFLLNGARAADTVNLAEASVCVAVETTAHESSRRGGEEVSIAAAAPRPLPSERSR